MKDPGSVPDNLRALDAALARVRFQPRQSLGPEILGRLRRGERLKGAAPLRFSRRLLGAAAVLALLLGGSAWWLTRRAPDVSVDRCCFDFDGGGPADDGVLVVARRGEQVRRLAVYEDRDGSHSFTPDDVVRFDRGPTVSFAAVIQRGAVTAGVCCSDLDGAGPPDDGLFLVTIPPDQVTLAALYEQRSGEVPAQSPLR